MKIELLGHTVNPTPMSVLAMVRYWWNNRRSAYGTIRKLKSREIYPKMLVDFGAHGSEWSQYLMREWPQIGLISYEPNPNCMPKGEVRRKALGIREGSLIMEAQITEEGYASPSGNLTVPMIRFDSEDIKIKSPALLKVDCENMTWQALAGCGTKLSLFDAVHVEMMNYELGIQYVNQQADIWNTLLLAGFKYGHVVDCAIWPRNVAYYDILFLKK